MAVTPQTNSTLEDIAEIIASKNSFVICGHVSPDGDCIGSQLALAHTLRSIGKSATTILVKDDPILPLLLFLPGAQDLVAAEKVSDSFDVFIGVDVPSRERIGSAACEVLDRCTDSITIDHHPSDKPMSNHLYVDPDVASTTTLIWKLSKLLCEDVPEETALCVYTGLLTDTGGFQFQNTDADAFECASELVAAGVKPALVARNVFQNRSMASVKLESLVVSRMNMLVDGQVALGYVTTEEVDELHAVKTDTDSLVDSLRRISGVRVACMLRQQDNEIRGNLRAKDDTDVSELARKLGGGGHKAAAGFVLREMSMDDARAMITRELEGLF